MSEDYNKTTYDKHHKEYRRKTSLYGQEITIGTPDTSFPLTEQKVGKLKDSEREAQQMRSEPKVMKSNPYKKKRGVYGD